MALFSSSVKQELSDVQMKLEEILVFQFLNSSLKLGLLTMAQPCIILICSNLHSSRDVSKDVLVLV